MAHSNQVFLRAFKIGKKGKKSLEVRVAIHPTRREMQLASAYGKCVAFTRCYKTGIVAAIIHLAKGDIDRGTIAHEAVHAASGVLSRFGQKGMAWRFSSGKASNDEEELAKYTGQITSAIHTVVGMGKFKYMNE